METPDPRFELSRITETEWLIHDMSLPADDPGHVIACIHERGAAEAEAVWLRFPPLASSYATAFDALDDLVLLSRSVAGEGAQVAAPLRPVAPAP